MVELTTGFRVPAAVLAFADRLLPTLGVEVPTVHCVRSDGTRVCTGPPTSREPRSRASPLLWTTTDR